MNIKKYNMQSDCPYCVLGVADTEAGRCIEDEMRAWLEPRYRLIEIWHDGSLFEQPALRYMQDLCKETGEPCLYLHTRGAYNFHPSTTLRTRRMWRAQFGKERDKYFGLVNVPEPTAACPFTGSEKYTWYNGFVANAEAMRSIPAIEPSEDRMTFERIFRGSEVNVIGVFLNVPDKDNLESLNAARAYLKANYKSKI